MLIIKDGFTFFVLNWAAYSMIKTTEALIAYPF